MENTVYGTPCIVYFCSVLQRVHWVELNEPTAYTRMQFLRAVSHSVGAHAVPDDAAGDSDAEDDDDDEQCNDSDDNDQPQSAVSSPQSQVSEWVSRV